MTTIPSTTTNNKPLTIDSKEIPWNRTMGLSNEDRAIFKFITCCIEGCKNTVQTQTAISPTARRKYFLCSDCVTAHFMKIWKKEKNQVQHD